MAMIKNAQFDEEDDLDREFQALKPDLCAASRLGFACGRSRFRHVCESGIQDWQSAGQSNLDATALVKFYRN